MTNDRFSRLLLTVIALSLAVIAVRGIIPDALAAAGDPMKCEIVGTVNIGGKIAIDTFSTPITVKGADEFRVKVSDTVPVRVERIDGTVQTHSN